MFTKDRIEEVYEFIWNYVTEREALPSYQQVVDGLVMPKDR
jgi:hypothetical protein